MALPPPTPAPSSPHSAAVEQLHAGPSRPGVTWGMRAVARGVTVAGGGRGEMRPGFFPWGRLAGALPLACSPLRSSRKGVPVASEAAAEPCCPEHKIPSCLPPPRGPERLVRAGRARLRSAGRAVPV